MIQSKTLSKKDIQSSPIFKKNTANERGLVTGTILGHLCTYVATGKIEANKLIDSEKLDQICTVIKLKGTDSSGVIKAALSDDYTYTDIKIALAHYGTTIG
jgi:hypothetical protein